MYDKKIFSERIKELRNSRKETQKEFAAAVSSTAATISAYENGTKNPSLEVVANIAKTCNVSIDWLCGLSNKKQINKKVETYGDIINIAYEISTSGHALGLGFYVTFSQTPCGNTFIDIAQLSFYNNMAASALEEFEKIYELYVDETINREMYNILIEGIIKKYNEYDLPVKDTDVKDKNTKA